MSCRDYALITNTDSSPPSQHMQELWLFWRKVQRLYKAGLLAQPSADDPGFFSRSWAGRGRMYRMLVEPLDIANWYYKDKHLTPSGHYIDGIVDELQDDNDKRPGRYILLQQQEDRAFGSAASSLGKARQLKALLVDRSWHELPGATTAAATALRRDGREFWQQEQIAPRLAVARFQCTHHNG